MTIHPKTHEHSRLLAPDLARGVMLLLIAIANVSVFLWGQPTNGISSHPTDGSTMDRVLAALTIVFVDARIYPMFAFLFGYGMLQFTMHRLDRGIPFPTVSRMLMRRHLWLIVFGAVHALLLFAGDVLGAYGLTGLAVAAILLRASERTMRALLWTLGSVVAAMLVLGAVALVILSAILPGDFLSSGAGAMDVPAWTTADLMAGIESWWWAALARLGLWILSTPGSVLTLVVPLCVMLGGYAGRHRWLEFGTRQRVKLGTVAPVGITAGVISGIPGALAHLGVLDQGDLALTGWAVLAQLGGIAAGVGYAALFALIALRVRHTSLIMRWIAAVGQRSLSFYLLQSLVFAPLFSAWAFGLGSRVGTSEAFAVAVGVWVVSVAIAGVLDRSGKRGPAEVILRTLTYGRTGSGTR